MSKLTTISKIINQVNSLNKKIKKFKEEGIDDHLDFITAMFNDKQMQYKKDENDNIISLTKAAKTFYGKQNILQLTKTLHILTKINNHNIFGTVKKFKDYSSEQFNTLKHTVREVLLKKGYSSQLVEEIVNNKAFYTSLLLAFKEAKKKDYESDQTIEKTFLSYANGKMSQEDIDQAVSDIEYSVTKQRELMEDVRDYNEYLETKRGKR